MGSLSSTAPTVVQILGRLLLRPISFRQCPSSGQKCFFSQTLLPRNISFFLPCSFSILPARRHPSPPHKRRCLQAKFTAAPGLSLRRCRPGVRMAEARNRALFICKGRLNDSLGWQLLTSTVLPSGLVRGFSAPWFSGRVPELRQALPSGLCVMVVGI